MSLLIYGAYGYSGELIARRAVQLGLPITLAGRDPARTATLAVELGVPHRAFGLDTPAEVDAGLAGMSCVLHCAGPFSATSAQMVSACLRTGVHYLDITGEWKVFEAAAARTDEARERGVMLMPGVGLDVVPTDCLAAHLKARLPDAQRLTLALFTNGGLSHGTATTMRENLGQPGVIRRAGRLMPVPVGDRQREFDLGFDAGKHTGIRMPWGDVATAWYTTGIPDIEVYACLPLSVRLGARLMGLAGGLLRTKFVQDHLQRRIEAAGPGPDAAHRARTSFWVYGEAVNAEGRSVAARMRLPDGYAFTAQAAVAIADRVLRGQWNRGFQTPGGVYGPDFVLDLDDVKREELP
jgi:short subunit dehydrogenase-like uncharacterized protein